MIKALMTRDYTQLQDYEPSVQEVFYSKENRDYKRPLQIVFVVGKTSVCGGAKIIFQQANLLQEQGCQVSIVAHHKKPTWYPIHVDYIQVPVHLALQYGVPDCDIIVATYYTQIKGLIDTGIAPVVYFEQGDTHLYRFEDYSLDEQRYIKGEISSAPFVVTVSKGVAKEMQRLFQVSPEVLHNGIDHHTFCHVGEKPKDDYLLMMGDGGLYYKGISDVIEASNLVKQKEKNLKLYWITPNQPNEELAKRVDQVFISPSQEEIAGLYGGAKLYVSGSYYESFALPIIEAMACGCPVVAVKNLGLLDYAMDGTNLLLVEPRRPDLLAEKITQVLQDSTLQSSLKSRGLSTIKDYLWINCQNNYLKYYTSISYYKNVSQSTLDEWEIDSALINKSNLPIKLTKMMLHRPISEVWAVRKVETPLGTVGWWGPIACKLATNKDQECNDIKTSDTKAKHITKDKVIQTGFCYVDVEGDQTLQHELLSNLRGMLEDQAMSQGEERQQFIKVYKKLDEGKEPEAIQELDSYLQSHKQCSELWLLKAYIEGKESQYYKTIEDYIKILGDYACEEIYLYDLKSWLTRIEKGEEHQMERKSRDNKVEEVYYFADKLYEYGLYEDAALYYEQFILGKDGDVNSKVGACRRQALCEYFLKHYSEARQSCFKTFQYTLPRGEECYLVGLTFQEEEKWEEAIYWFDQATKCKRPPYGTPYHNEDDWGFNPLLSQCICYYELGDLEKANRYNEEAGLLKPNHENVIYNRDFFRSL